MADYNVNDLVDVRATTALAWRAGTVTAKQADRWQVTLDSAVTANDWSGATRKYAGTNTLTVVYIQFNAEVVEEGALIRNQGG